MLKILGGKLKGLSLKVADDSITRPTSVMLRRKIFDAHQDLTGCRFVDLCAGSGAMGLEALSRGADEVFFVESHSKTLRNLRTNCEGARSRVNYSGDDLIHTSSKDVLVWLKEFKAAYEGQDSQSQESWIVFFDPPYEKHDLYTDFFNMMVKDHWFRGVLWVESDKLKGPGESFWQNYMDRVIRTYKQGDNFIYLFHFTD